MAVVIPQFGLNFPFELVDMIIDYNHSDQPTLMACALVARQWTSRSRFHLFSKVDISHSNARQFINILSTPSCTFAMLVHQLDVHLVPGSQKWFNEFSRRLSLLDDVLITSLGILGAKLTIFREEAQEAASSLYPNIRSLTVSTVSFETLSDFASFVCGFRMLHSLSCSAIILSPCSTIQRRFSAPLSTLNLTSPSIKLILDYLRNFSTTLPFLTSLSLSHLTFEDCVSFKAFLETPNTSLRELSVRVDMAASGVSLGTFADIFDMAQLNGLHQLHIDTMPSIPPNVAVDFVTKIRSPNLQVLEISALLATGVAALDMLLTSPRFSSLKKVTVLKTDWADTRQFMPHCFAHGILQQY